MNILDYKNLILSSIVTLTLVFMPSGANAQYNGQIHVDGYGNPPQTYAPRSVYYYEQPVYIDYVQSTPTPTPIIYSTTVNPSANTVAPAPKTVAKAKTSTSTNTSKTNNNLVASAISGNDNFMPSSLSEWIVFVILVLLIVALTRKIYGGKEKYDSVPMKHA